MERDLAIRTEAASMQMDMEDDGNISGRALKQQRQTFEEILKLSAQSLSNKTEADTLVKLLRICAFIEHD